MNKTQAIKTIKRAIWDLEDVAVFLSNRDKPTDNEIDIENAVELLEDVLNRIED